MQILNRNSARLCFVLMLAALSPSEARPENRLAILIGNADYDLPELSLNNPVNDIDALAPALERLGFETARYRDADRAEMVAALSRLRQDGRRAEAVLVFYAGHGVQVGAENYLIGTGLGDLDAEAVAAASLTLTDIRRAIADAGADLAMVVLDACRDNPLLQRGMVPSGLLPSSGGAGTLIAYSTDPGNVAADGLGDNSIFTQALLRNIETPGLDVRLMFGRVRQEVVMLTGGLQIPWVEEAVLGEHYLHGAPELAAVDEEILAWRRADSAGTAAEFESYLGEYPSGLFAQMARTRIALLREERQPVGAAALAPEDLAPTAAALELLGYLATADAPGGTGREAVETAFRSWSGAQPDGFGTPRQLLQDGAQMALMLGTYTAGILRKDLQNFSAAEQNLRLAVADLVRAEAEFGGVPSAAADLAAMRADVAAIRRLRDEMAGHLDTSRSFYDDLVTLSEGPLAGEIRSLPLPRFGGVRGLGQDVPIRALQDARTFTGHLALMEDRPEGSYAWLADLMRETTP